MFRASLCPSSGEQSPYYCIWCVVLVLLDVVGNGCGALRCRMWSLFCSTETFTVITSCKTAPHNRYQTHPAKPEHTNAVIRPLFFWRWAIWCPKHVETEFNNKHLIVASCWCSVFIHSFLLLTDQVQGLNEGGRKITKRFQHLLWPQLGCLILGNYFMIGSFSL